MRKTLIITVIWLAFAVAIAGCGHENLEDSVHEVVLDNGMKWFLVKRGYAPVFAGIVQVKVGGADEEAGKTGLAHFFEHMVFKGTSEIGTKDFEAEKKLMDKIDRKVEEGDRKAVLRLLEKQRKYIVSDEIWDILMRAGAANVNAYTNKDVTAYYAEMPSSKVELWAYLASKMISDPAFREFYSERDVILEELRMRSENEPRGKLFDTFADLAYKRNPYRWPVIGVKDDVAKLTRDDLKKFYKKNYVPECMVGAIVGDINIRKTKKYLKKYFGQLLGTGKVCERTTLIEPPQEEERVGNVEFDAEPILLLGYHKPTLPNFDDYVFDVITYTLCTGASSRMNKHLVQEKKIAKRVGCSSGFPGSRLDNMFIVYAEPYRVEDLGELKKDIIKELRALYTNGVTEGDLKKAKEQMKTDFLSQIDSNFKLARLLVEFENLAGTWRYLLNHPKNIDLVTDDNLKEVAKKYFVPENMTSVTLKRGGGS